LEEVNDDSDNATQSRRTFKYKTSHLEEIIVENNNS